ncbi:unnamed protein product [Didymodactylos carnosus]|uniref:Uncharacterized protein n=1 Tax=Didymodactylos carnosus TaxID=1234261 RepID=A0A814TDK4_9BILA|nr:unnamed protein product [Didymodactylos carnosus]CAF3923879.1 unnamed protein product [Didymodactylos carnosus]
MSSNHIRPAETTSKQAKNRKKRDKKHLRNQTFQNQYPPFDEAKTAIIHHINKENSISLIDSLIEKANPRAVAVALDRFLDKSCTIGDFGCGLDDRLSYHRCQYRRQLSEYAANDCLAVTQLFQIISQRTTTVTTSNHVSASVIVPSASALLLDSTSPHPTSSSPSPHETRTIGIQTRKIRQRSSGAKLRHNQRRRQLRKPERKLKRYQFTIKLHVDFRFSYDDIIRTIKNMHLHQATIRVKYGHVYIGFSNQHYYEHADSRIDRHLFSRDRYLDISFREEDC